MKNNLKNESFSLPLGDTMWYNIVIIKGVKQMEIQLLEASKSVFIAKKKEAEANLKIYLSNPVGIGEHGDVIEVITGFISTITEATDNIATIDSVISTTLNAKKPTPLFENTNKTYENFHNHELTKTFNPGTST